MSTCISCQYVLYDGTCLARGKHTTLDAPMCDLFVPKKDVKMAQLKRENAELRELVRDAWMLLDNRWNCMCCPRSEECDECECLIRKSIMDRMAGLGIEVDG